MNLHIIPALKDNYIWLLVNKKHQAVIIDPSDAEVVIAYLSTHNIEPIAILLTHHHADHIAGVPLLYETYANINIYAPDEVIDKLSPNVTTFSVSALTNVSLYDFEFAVLSTPGHTLGHVAYYFAPYLFCGDVLFSAGCGRVFEGSFEQMFCSINKIKALPDETFICAGHEYTKSNLTFATALLPDDIEISNYFAQIKDQHITLPSILATERKINLFLRCDERPLQLKFGIDDAFSLFCFFRKQKDNF